jgi:outer membrane protein OmpA-like peptidoglycan-associated protein
MATSMFESILGMATSEMKQTLAVRLGEPIQTIQKGLGTATAMTLGGLTNNADDPGFLDKVLQLAGQAGSQNLLGSLGSIASNGPTGAIGDLVGRFTSLVFGGQEEQVTGGLAQHAGLTTESASALLKMAAPLVLGYLGKMHAVGGGTVSTSALSSMLKAEAPGLSSYVPPGFLKVAPGTVGEAAGRTARAVDAGPIGHPRLGIAAAIVAAVLLGWLFSRAMHGGRPANQVASTASNPQWQVLGAIVKVRLPDGAELNVPSNGVETRLITYLQSTSAPTAVTFDFDRLQFDTDTARLQPASQEQLNNVAEILKAYPTVKIRLGGYTDNTGDPAANQRLSEERADTVMTELTRRGVDQTRLSAEGYGQANPVADNGTEEGRQKNRRVSIRVAEK